MKATEFRTGNLVHPCSEPNPVILPHTGLISRIFEIRFEGAMLLNDITKPAAQQEPIFYEWNKISPIPLSEKLLANWEFQPKEYKVDKVGFYEVSYFNIKLEAIGFGFFYTEGVGFYIRGLGAAVGASFMPFRYVHELQNAFYCLTQKELQHYFYNLSNL